MTASRAYNETGLTGYRLHELAVAFDRVMNPRDWQAPIRSVIAAADRDLMEQAVLWFTHTTASFEEVSGEADRLVITAPGYRMGTRGQG